MRPFSVNVFCGARGNNAWIGKVVGVMLAASGTRVIYGGSRFGMMGALADGVIEASTDGRQAIIGYMPRYLKDNYAHKDVLVYETDSLHDRKRRMMDESDAFLCLPGGVGTLDELFSAWGEAKLGEVCKPIALLNMFGFWDGMLAQLRRCVDEGFLSAERMKFLRELTCLEDVDAWLSEIRASNPKTAECDSDG